MVAVVLPLGRVKGGERAQAGTNVVIEVCERRDEGEISYRKR